MLLPGDLNSQPFVWATPLVLNSNTASPPVRRACCWLQCEQELRGLISAHVCSWKLFTAFFTPPQRHLHTFHCNMQPYFGSWCFNRQQQSQEELPLLITWQLLQPPGCCVNPQHEEHEAKLFCPFSFFHRKLNGEKLSWLAASVGRN